MNSTKAVSNTQGTGRYVCVCVCVFCALNQADPSVQYSPRYTEWLYNVSLDPDTVHHATVGRCLILTHMSHLHYTCNDRRFSRGSGPQFGYLG